MPDNKNQHFVPQFCLKHFSADGATIGLCVLESGKIVTRAPIKSQSSEDYFYGKDGAEDVFKQLEGQASAAFADLISNNKLPEPMSAGFLVLQDFLLIQSMRTRGHFRQTNQLIERLGKKVATEIPDLAEHANEISFSDRDLMLMSLRRAKALRAVIDDLAWKLLLNKTACPLITSDNPVATYNPYLEKRRPDSGATGPASIGVQMFLPVDTKRVLMVYDASVYRVGGRQRAEPCIEIALERDIEALNTLQAANAETVVFFHPDTDVEQIKVIVRRACRSSDFDRVVVTEQPAVFPDGSVQTLLRATRRSLCTGLEFGFAVIAPRAAGRRLDGPLVRNPAQLAAMSPHPSGVNARQLVEKLLGKSAASPP